jgi:hypothetical protein
MLFLRTAAGDFVNAATIVRLCEETDGNASRWVAIRDDDREVALAAYYSRPGRLKELQHLLRPTTSSVPGPSAQEAACGPAGCDCAF